MTTLTLPGRVRHALALGLLLPVSALAQTSPDPASGASTSGVWFGYESATDAYRSNDAADGAGDAPTARPLPDTDLAPPPTMSMRESTGTMAMDDAADEPAGLPAMSGSQGAASEIEVAPVAGPIRKLQESTSARRGSEPGPVGSDASGPVRPGIEYESAFEAYDRYVESEGSDWRGSNDRVGEIGGWKTYAREMYETATDGELQ